MLNDDDDESHPTPTSHRTIWPEQDSEQDKPVSEQSPQTYQKFLTTCNG